MERREVLKWFHKHPNEVHDAPEEVISRCEEEVRDHAHEEAWLRARDIAEQRVQYWRDSWGAHASESFVAREVCKELATDLKRCEPIPGDGEETEFVEDDVLEVLEPAARSLLLRYVRNLAREEEHRVWHEVIGFTRSRGRSLGKDPRFSSDLGFEETHNYAETAARVMNILAHEYEQHAFPVRF